jgi:cytochrome c biogenesis protein CcmG, thiol:disulfide interchange protein DsbE
VREGRPEVDLGGLDGRPTVVNVLAAWCVPCEEELPDMQAVHAELKDQVQFIGIDRQDSRRKARELLERTGVTFPVGYDPDDTLFPRLRAVGMPTTLFVDAKGRIVAKVSGQLSRADLRAKIAAHLGVK